MASPQALATLQGFLTTTRLWHSVAAAANLGVADGLANGPLPADEIATTLRADPGALYRLLRVLAAGGVLVEHEDGRFELTEVGQLLRTDQPGSMRDWVRYMGRPYVQEAWASMDRSIRTGENTFTALHGENVWQWRTHEPAERELFDGA